MGTALVIVGVLLAIFIGGPLICIKDTIESDFPIGWKIFFIIGIIIDLIVLPILCVYVF